MLHISGWIISSWYYKQEAIMNSRTSQKRGQTKTTTTMSLLVGWLYESSLSMNFTLLKSASFWKKKDAYIKPEVVRITQHLYPMESHLKLVSSWIISVSSCWITSTLIILGWSVLETCKNNKNKMKLIMIFHN